jgi:hypothetical protein
MILHFQKEINIIVYIIKKNIKLKFNHFVWTKFQHMNFQILFFVMFKMKYLINKMQCNTLSQQVWWLDGRGVYLHPRG